MKKLYCVVLVFAFMICGTLAYSTSVSAAKIAEWKMDEGGGASVGDFSNSGKDGVRTGATWVDGVMGSALNFTGSDTYVTVPSSIAGLSSWSVKAWIKPGNSANDCYVYSEKTLSTNFYVKVTSQNELVVGTWNANRADNWDVISTASDKIIRNKWNYIVVTLEGAGMEAGSGTVKCYVNGILAGGGGLGSCQPYAITGAEGAVGEIMTVLLTRLDGGIGKTPGADFDNIYPWSEMKLCNVADDGEINAYIGNDDFKRDGSNGQVMVRIPKFYYKRTYDGSKQVFSVADGPASGYKLHPAFIRDGIEKPHVLVGAYEGWVDSNSTLCSVSGVYPTTSKTIGEFRTYAQKRGTGWNQIDVQSYSAIQILYLVEYANINSKAAIGVGKTSWNSIPTGLCDGIANGASGAVSQAVSYRGIENIWGNLKTYLEGINLQERAIYTADHDFASDTFTEPYTYTGLGVSGASGCVGIFRYSEKTDWLFVPECVSFCHAISDYKQAYGGNTVVNVGGNVNDATGMFAIGYNNGSSINYNTLGSRIAFIP